MGTLVFKLPLHWLYIPRLNKDKAMPRASQQTKVISAVREYLALAELHLPTEAPLDVRSVAAKIHVSPTTLYKYHLEEEIHAAQERQRKQAKLSGRALEQRAYIERIKDLQAALEQEQKRNKGLVAQIAIMEANAARLCTNPEELYRAIPRPNRSTAHTGRKSSRSRNYSAR